MQEYFIQLSKYIITILIALYTFQSFLVFRFKEEHQRKGIYIIQEILFFLIQFTCFYTLYLKSGDADYLFFYAFLQVFFFSAMILTRMIYEKINRLLLNNMCMLLGIGFVILSRLSKLEAALTFQNPLIKQLAIVIISLMIGLTIPYVLKKITFLRKLTWLYASVGLFLLSIVLVLGNLTRGSKISFTLWDITFQPSEFVKLIFIFFLAAALFEDISFKRVVLTTIIAALHVIILVVSKDLGSALIFFVGYIFVVFMATGSYLYMFLGLLAGSIGAVGAYHIFDHVRLRVLIWKDPFSYIDNEGFQITQSLFAIGSGNWFGMGLYSGTPRDIPFVSTDLVFSAVCEELGVISGICTILICISCFIMMMNIGIKFKDNFYRLLSLGFGVIYIFQVFLTIGGGIKFIPLTGVTLPFISYGGSSVLTTMIMFFLVQGLYYVQVKTPLHQEGGKKHVAKRQVKRQEDRP